MAKHIEFFDELKSVSDEQLEQFGHMLDSLKRSHAPIVIDSYSQVAQLNNKGMVDSLLCTYSGVAPQLPVKAKGKTAMEVLNEQMKGAKSALGDSLLDAFIYGSGLMGQTFSVQEQRMIFTNARRGNGKSMWPQVFLWDEAEKHTVKHDLKMLQSAQTSNGPGKDPLFEAMDKHNQLIRLGRKAIKEMFHATPLNLNQKSNGPYKAKDWE